MTGLVSHIRETLISTPDTVCLERARLVTEACREYEKVPAVLRRAHAFRHVLEHMTLDLHTNPVFAGNTSSRPRAWMLLPEYGFLVPDQAEVEHDWTTGFLDGDAIPADLRSYWEGRSFGGAGAVGHLAADVQRVVREGLESVIAEARRDAGEGDAAVRQFREAAVIACEAVVAWAQRYADAAEEAADAATDPSLRDALVRVADACRRVPAQPARNLFEALQTIALVHLAIAIEGHGFSVSVGLLDRILQPFADEARDGERTTELLAAFLLKLTANSVWGSFSKTQAVTVGGLDHDGADQCSELTLCILDAFALARVGDPHLFLRWHRGMDPRVKSRAVEMLRGGLSMPLLVGDEQTTAGLINAGIAPEDAWSYCVIGCNELGMPGKVAESALGPDLNYLAELNAVLFELDAPDRIRCMDDLCARLEAQMTETCRRAFARHQEWRRRMAEEMPTPFTSSLMDGCLARGRDLHTAYDLPGMYERGLTNATNALANIERLVFTDRALSLRALVAALKGNLDDAAIRAQLLAGPKWGNDDDRADRWALELVAMRERVKQRVEKELGHPHHLSCHVVRSLHFLDGRNIAASADGRPAHAPVADSIGAATGTAIAGPTALLNSVRKLKPAEYYQGGYNLNLNLTTAAVAGDDVPPRLAAMIDAFLAYGGQELQLNCQDVDTLRAAQEDPERYRDLLVRVAGFNALFVQLSRREQDALIRRAENAW
ncbi:MAG: hypothetical protein JSV65_04145 [Armatimonadota bacterium]|nr:MAG: hypothetical protein JSV65_04145 [Armatimonadota bacterium]